MSYSAGLVATHSRADVARRIRDTLRMEILQAPCLNRLLPSEGALMAREGASRTAIRMALDLLREEGLVKRLPGVGTIAVEQGQLAFPLDPPRSVERNLEGKSHLIDYRTVSLFETWASPGIASYLDLTPRDPCVFAERLTVLDGVPMSLVSIWVPRAYGTPLFERLRDFSNLGIFDILEQEGGLDLCYSDYSLEATSADRAVAALLDVPEGAPLLLRSTLSRLADGRPVSFAYTRGRSDRVRYEFRGIHAGGATSPGCKPR